MKKILAHVKKHGISDFGSLLTIYHKSTGLMEKLNTPHDSIRVEEYLNSLKAQKDREWYFQLFDYMEKLRVSENGEEMEEK